MNSTSALKDFEVIGFNALDGDRKVLARGKYNIDGPTAQTFAMLDERSRSAHEYVSLRIHSNHGNTGYTCLYRFRVHGDVQ